MSVSRGQEALDAAGSFHEQLCMRGPVRVLGAAVGQTELCPQRGYSLVGRQAHVTVIQRMRRQEELWNNFPEVTQLLRTVKIQTQTCVTPEGYPTSLAHFPFAPGNFPVSWTSSKEPEDAVAAMDLVPGTGWVALPVFSARE